MPDTRLTVFELLNEARKEIFVGASPLPAADAFDAIHRVVPLAIKHWDFAELGPNCLRVVEPNLPEAAARAFIATYVKTSLPAGWRYISG